MFNEKTVNYDNGSFLCSLSWERDAATRPLEDNEPSESQSMTQTMPKVNY